MNDNNTPHLIHSLTKMIRCLKRRGVFLLLCSIISTSISSQSFTYTNSIGIRYQTNLIGELSYQHVFNNSKRLEVGLSISGNKFTRRSFLAGTYQWNKNILPSFNAYAGPTISFAYYSDERSKNSFHVGVGGQIGLEYDFNKFNAPIVLSLDTRPIWNPSQDEFNAGIAIGIRYTLNANKVLYKKIASVFQNSIRP
ncbi:hypothetical protein OAB01_02320 [Bacteroidia bacterium]|nr:hypothetical protein [Bacteroidia bacterium]